MPAAIRPAVRSLLTRSAAAAGGVVHGDVTFATCGDWRSWSTIWVPAARAAALSTPSGAETTMSSWTSPWWNLSVNSSVALEDSAVGSWNPLADRLLATGTPKTPSATVTNAATAITRRGAAMASLAVRYSSSSILRSVREPSREQRRSAVIVTRTGPVARSHRRALLCPWGLRFLRKRVGRPGRRRRLRPE